jgi:hypothetical protein
MPEWFGLTGAPQGENVPLNGNETGCGCHLKGHARRIKLPENRPILACDHVVDA